jgi:uncharacterized membrane protein YedE/YeeE
MQTSTVLSSLAGGVLIGISASLVLLVFGRIAGISGILGRLLLRDTLDRDWRMAFLGGLLVSGAAAAALFPHAVGETPVSLPLVAVAGVLVGVGTRLGNGCTSGHGVCGISRLSKRSIAATMTFMVVAAITVAIVRAAGGWS